MPALSPDTLFAIERAEQLLGTLCVSPGDLVAALSRRIAGRNCGSHEDELAALRHSLSDVIMAQAPVRPSHDGRSVDEARVLTVWMPRLDEAIKGNDDDVLTVAEQLCSDLGGKPMRCRTGPMSLVDCDGASVITFAAPTPARRRLAQVLRNLHSPPMGSVLVAAAQTLVATVNAHVMTDCNGRLGRLLFHYRLRRNGLALKGYLPLYELFQASEGGYEIRLRLAELYDEWDEFVLYLCKIVGLAHKLGRGE